MIPIIVVFKDPFIYYFKIWAHIPRKELEKANTHTHTHEWSYSKSKLELEST